LSDQQADEKQHSIVVRQNNDSIQKTMTFSYVQSDSYTTIKAQ